MPVLNSEPVGAMVGHLLRCLNCVMHGVAATVMLSGTQKGKNGVRGHQSMKRRFWTGSESGGVEGCGGCGPHISLRLL